MRVYTAHSILFCAITVITVSCKAEPQTVDIQNIYNQFVHNNDNTEYKNRYVSLPLEKNNKNWRWEGKDFPRIVAVLEFERFIKEHAISAEKALFVDSFNDPEEEFLTCKSKKAIHYEEDPINHDLHRLNLPEKDFDFVMLNQVLEHVYDPIRCLQNVHKHMNPSGILYLNAPANNIPHSTPFHYYTGFTATGLGAILQAAGFKILSIGQWGNAAYLKLLFSKNSWPDYRELAQIEPNPGINDFNCPIIVWAFAQKE